jgi:hypothetical protein
MSDDQIAPEGSVWVCGACGKTAKDRYGGPNDNPLWDESCMLNAVLCDATTLVMSGSRVVKAEAWKPPHGQGGE